MKKNDVVIVGGGLAGLASAVDLARRSRPVRILERSAHLGGRARTERAQGFSVNLGPHALYRKGAGEQYLAELEIPVPARRVSSNGTYVVHGEKLAPLPGGFVSLLTTDVLDLSGKLELARFMGTLGRLDPATLSGRTASDWLATIQDETLRALLHALVRVATYANAPDLLSAELAAEQLKRAVFHGVSYLDGGWQSLIDALRDAAVDAGAVVEENARVTRVLVEEGAVVGVELQDRRIEASTVLIAGGGPKLAADLTGAGSLQRFATEAVPLYAATLDVCLDRRIAKKVKFATRLDRPVYFSVHSDTANVAAEGGSMVHAMMYLPVGETADPKAIEGELRALFERIQPGWNNHAVSARFLPRLLVTHALVTASGGFGARPGPAVPEIDGLYVSGDWVGDSGFLADASLASARAAAAMIAKRGEAKAAA